MAALSAAPTAPSPFASLLRRSRFTSHDPLISQIYTTHGGHASRGDWGLKRPLALRKDGKYITLQSTDSRHQVTEWQGARQPWHWIRRWEELGAEAEVSSKWGEGGQGGGGGDKAEQLDSEFGRGVEEGERERGKRWWEMGDFEEAMREVLKDATTEEIEMFGLGREELVSREEKKEAQALGEVDDIPLEDDVEEDIDADDVDPDSGVPYALEVQSLRGYVSVPNVMSMNPKAFDRYISRLRTHRPEFKSFLAAEAALTEQKRAALKAQAPSSSSSSNKYNYSINNNQTTVARVSPNIFEQSTMSSADMTRKRFLMRLAQTEYHSPSSRQIEQKKHHNGGLTYTKLGPLTHFFLNKPQPGRKISIAGTGTQDQNGMNAVAFAGMYSHTTNTSWTDHSQASNNNNNAIPMRVTSATLIDAPRAVKSGPPRGLQEVNVETKLVDVSELFRERIVDYRPGTRAYLVQQAIRAETSTGGGAGKRGVSGSGAGRTSMLTATMTRGAGHSLPGFKRESSDGDRVRKTLLHSLENILDKRSVQREVLSEIEEEEKMGGGSEA
ncbi:uncharacterized protein STEHIDRAFT_137435 [Stereum hirsutum FP-91666 SS1]|uniref:uncharacterized protein n=1 Tax=Stereum hirsutum (strain FP-91666) TaxID=721885 RepID=UPI000440A1E3|nr:uncharacterized protein STEHIDRAFT_137435 [Stereum hirsutum FP-91666 SS1]EIM89761.1 hypothetical protein STEHIDRAFT_137435 [Stereum hirsutum FP-91666 SS1]